jgi:hypothetical protein
MSWASTPATPNDLGLDNATLPEGFGVADYFNGGALKVRAAATGADTSTAVYDSTALADGALDVVLDAAPAVTPVAGDMCFISTSAGVSFGCEVDSYDSETSTVSLKDFVLLAQANTL